MPRECMGDVKVQPAKAEVLLGGWRVCGQVEGHVFDRVTRSLQELRAQTICRGTSETVVVPEIWMG